MQETSRIHLRSRHKGSRPLRQAIQCICSNTTARLSATRWSVRAVVSLMYTVVLIRSVACQSSTPHASNLHPLLLYDLWLMAVAMFPSSILNF